MSAKKKKGMTCPACKRGTVMVVKQAHFARIFCSDCDATFQEAEKYVPEKPSLRLLWSQIKPSHQLFVASTTTFHPRFG